MTGVLRGGNVDGGAFGRWARDADGSPTYLVGGPAIPDGVLPPGGLAACWHQIGNAGLTATAHAGGWVTLWATSRGMVRLTGPSSRWGVVGEVPMRRRARFGCGYAAWEASYAGGLLVRRRVGSPCDDTPVLRVDVEIAHPDGRLAVAYEEDWVVEPTVLLVGALMSPHLPPPPGASLTHRLAWHATYGLSAVARALTTAARAVASARLVSPPRFDADRRAVWSAPRHPPRPAHGPAWVDRSLPTLVVASLDEDVPCEGWGSALRLRVGEVGRGRTERLAFAVVLADDPGDVDALIDRARQADPAANARSWGSLAVLDTDGRAPALERETPWHAAYLVGAQQPDAYFGHRYVSQGSAYGFVHGLQGAPRDYAIFSVPLTLIDPAGARHLLQVMMRMTRPSGSVLYAHTGRGQCTSGGVHAAPTDLPIFFLWALTEYVWATGDRALLDQPVPFYPAEDRATATPRDRVAQAFHYLRDRVGRGPHGLLRVGSGDWADPIAAMVADRRAFHEHGESGFNTAFAVYVLPRAASLIAESHPIDAAEMVALAGELRRAMEHTWQGEWFLRGYDGRGGPLGERHLFLDGQVWPLIAGIGDDAQRARLVSTIGDRNDDPSPIGATILDRPHPVRFGMLAPGWDCNGGVWAAINALLAWGYALHDPARA